MAQQAILDESNQSSETFRQFQYKDLVVKSQDIYALTKYQILESFLESSKPLSILNVGCGSGDLSLRLAAAGHTVQGIDIEPAYIELAHRNAELHGDPANCTFAVSSIEDFHSDTKVDCVVSTDMLEHIEDDRTAFAKMMQALKPGGLLLLSVPAGQWLFGFHDEQLGHFRRYSKKSLLKIVDEHCTVESMRYFGFTLVPVCLTYSKWLRRPYPVKKAANVRRRPVRALVLRALMRCDRWVRMPVGTSLLMKGIKKG